MVGHNLRVPVSSFVGRSRELGHVDALLQSHRLVTLTGVGGCGKSRLATELCWSYAGTGIDAAASTFAQRWPDGIWWIDLSGATDADEIVRLCADALQVRLEPGGDLLSALVPRLRRRALLLCLDTCEHVLDAAAAVVSRLLEAAPGLRVMATTREPLALDGEAVWRVPSLAEDEAARLFAERAALAGAELSAADGPAIAAICRRVDCLALAVELAAAWTRAISVSRLLEGLEDRFQLLSGGPRRAVARHQALRASMDWSHQLLADRERVVFRRLAVFAGSFDEAAADAVCGFPPIPAGDVLPVLTRLVDQSLVVAQPVDGEGRYRLLDTVRQYANERLLEAGEAAPARDRHLAWFAHMAERAEAQLPVDQQGSLRRLGWDADNVAAAIEWGLQPDASRVERAGRLAVAMTMPWLLQGHAAAGFSVLDRLRAHDSVLGPELRAAVAASAGMLEMISGRHQIGPATASERAALLDTTERGSVVRARLLAADAFRHFFVDFDSCQRLAERAALAGAAAGDPFCRDFSQIMAAYSLTARDRHDEAVALVAPLVDGDQAGGDRFCAGFALGVTQYAAMQTGDLPGAVALGRRMVEAISPLGEYFGAATLTANWALAMALAGDGAAAREIMAPIAESADSAPDVDAVGFQVAMGQISLRQVRWDEAVTWYGRGIALLDEFGPFWTAARCVAGLAAALRRLGRPEQAQDVVARGERLAARFDSPQLSADLAEERALLTAGDPAQTLALLHRALAVRMRAGLRTFIPDSLDAIVRVTAAHQPALAQARALAATTRARQQMGYPRTAADGREYHETVDRLRAALGDRAFDDAWQAGSTTPLDEAVSLLARGRGARLRPKSGWSSLTPAEREVVGLVLSGLSNVAIGRQLFMSRSTVKTHLAHVYAKLAVSNRTELAAAAAKRDASA